MGIPLLSFPQLALDKIIPEMRLSELFHLSRLSKRTAALIKRSKQPQIVMSINAHNEYTGLIVGSQRNGNFYWQIAVKRPTQEQIEAGEQDFPKELSKIEVIRNQIYSTRFDSNVFVDSLIADAIAHLLYVFTNCQGEELKIWAYSPHMTQETAKAIVNCLEFTKSVDDRYDHQLPIQINAGNFRKAKRVVFYEAGWMTGQDLLCFEANTIELYGFNVTTEDLRDYLTRWATSSDKPVKRLWWLKIGGGRPQGFFDQLFLGLNSHPWNPEQRKRDYEGDCRLCCNHGSAVPRMRRCNAHEVICSEGTDIESDDGMLGTVVQHNTGTVFLAWHRRNYTDDCYYTPEGSESDDSDGSEDSEDSEDSEGTENTEETEETEDQE